MRISVICQSIVDLMLDQGQVDFGTLVESKNCKMLCK